MASKVFVSYSHDNDSHKAKVSEFVARLRFHDVKVTYDDDIARIGGPDEGWPRWCERQIIEADYVLVCCTAMFRDSFEGEETGGGHGVAWEAQAIRRYLYDNPNANRKIRPLILEECDRVCIPVALQSFHVFLASHDKSYSELLGWLKIAPAPAEVTLDSLVEWPSKSDSYRRLLADRLEEFGRFRNMLSGLTSQRVLLLQGPSSSGKTALIHECIAYAIHLHVPFAHADFKCGLTLDEVFETMVNDLGLETVATTFSSRGSARSHAIIADLQRSRRPLLLLFDTFQKAPQSCQNWIDILLSRVHRCPALLVVVAGQQIPEHSARHWAPLAVTVALPPILSVDEWVDFVGRTHGSVGVMREHIEALTLVMKGDPGKVSAMLGALVSRLKTGIPACPSNNC